MSLASSSSLGDLLREWRTTRHMSQMELAGEAEVSTRHLSFIENGKSKPSREMLLVLASALEIPLRERNSLLLAGGYAPAYRETDLDAPEMAQVRKTLELMLAQAEPFGAVVMDRSWRLLMSNAAASRTTMLLCHDTATMLGLGEPNLLRLLLHPAGLRKSILNWEEVARDVLGRAHREMRLEGERAHRELFEEVLAYPEVPADFRRVDLAEAPKILIPVHFKRGDFEARVFTTITTLGTATDITLQELRVEVFYPADPQSEATLRAIADAD